MRPGDPLTVAKGDDTFVSGLGPTLRLSHVESLALPPWGDMAFG